MTRMCQPHAVITRYAVRFPLLVKNIKRPDFVYSYIVAAQSIMYLRRKYQGVIVAKVTGPILREIRLRIISTKKIKKNVGRMYYAKKMRKSVSSSLYYFLSLRLSHLTSAIILGFLLFTGKCDEFKPDDVGKKKKK